MPVVSGEEYTQVREADSSYMPNRFPHVTTPQGIEKV